MKHVISVKRKPIKWWLKDVQPDALIKNKNLANLPFAFKHITLKPDSRRDYEIHHGSHGHMWIMIDSGSRNLRYLGANHDNKFGIEPNQKRHSIVTKGIEAPFNDVDNPWAVDGDEQINYDLEFCRGRKKLNVDFKIEFVMENDPRLPLRIKDIIHKANRLAASEDHFVNGSRPS